MELVKLSIVRVSGRASNRLCIEISLQIFEAVAKDDPGAVLRLTTVCSSWRVVATPLLYRYLKFFNRAICPLFLSSPSLTRRRFNEPTSWRILPQLRAEVSMVLSPPRDKGYAPWKFRQSSLTYTTCVHSFVSPLSLPTFSPVLSILVQPAFALGMWLLKRLAMI